MDNNALRAGGFAIRSFPLNNKPKTQKEYHE